MYVQNEDKFNTKWKKDKDGKLGKVTFYCTEKESWGGKVLKILTFVAATMHLILNQHKSYRTLLSAILNTGFYLHIILYIWIFPRFLLFYSIFDKMLIDKHIYNNNQSLNVQNRCFKSTIILPDSISAILNP